MATSIYAKNKKNPLEKKEKEQVVQPQSSLQNVTPAAKAPAKQNDVIAFNMNNKGELQNVNYKGKNISAIEYEQLREAQKTGATDMGVDRTTGGLSPVFKNKNMRELIIEQNLKNAVRLGKLPKEVLNQGVVQTPSVEQEIQNIRGGTQITSADTTKYGMSNTELAVTGLSASGSIAGGLGLGAKIGAGIGTAAFPGLGTAVGAVAGAIIGASGAVFAFSSGLKAQIKNADTTGSQMEQLQNAIIKDVKENPEFTEAEAIAMWERTKTELNAAHTYVYGITKNDISAFLGDAGDDLIRLEAQLALMPQRDQLFYTALAERRINMANAQASIENQLAQYGLGGEQTGNQTI